MSTPPGESRHAHVVAASMIAAGLIQAEANEVGPRHVAESDLRRCVRRGLQARLGPVVVPERSLGLRYWRPRLCGCDLVVVGDDGNVRWAIETKWCRNDVLYETLWDMLKVGLAVREAKAERGYLIAGATDSAWKQSHLAGIFASRSWTTRDLLSEFQDEWASLLKGNRSARLARLPRRLKTIRVAALPIKIAGGQSWSLRAAAVQPIGSDWLELANG